MGGGAPRDLWPCCARKNTSTSYFKKHKKLDGSSTSFLLSAPGELLAEDLWPDDDQWNDDFNDDINEFDFPMDLDM